MNNQILIIDNDASVRASLREILEGAGYRVALASGGPEAAVRLEAGEVDLVLLEVNLPSLSGWDVFERITTRSPLVPVIVITRLSNQQASATAAGAGALFEKPVNVAELLERIDQMLSEPYELRLRRLCGLVNDTKLVGALRAGDVRSPSEQFCSLAQGP